MTRRRGTGGAGQYWSLLKQDKEEDIYVIRTGPALVAVAQIPCSERHCAGVHVLLVIVLNC